MIKKGGAGFEVHKQIDIAAWTGVAPSDRAKHRDSMSPALPRNAEDLGTAAAQPFKGQHIVGHLLRVSPSGATWRSGRCRARAFVARHIRSTTLVPDHCEDFRC
jgi:hypothetical protein